MTTVHFKHPLILKTKDGAVVSTIAEVTIAALKAGQFLAALDEAGNKQGTLMRALIFYATRLARDDIDRLHMDDFMLISKELERFLPNGLTTGEMDLNSSQAPSGSPQDGNGGDQLN